MQQSIATIVIDPHALVREALMSLMAGHSYQIVGSFASTTNVENSTLAEDAPRLVILGALPVDEAASAAANIRKMWPETKIILLFDRASSADVQTLLASEVGGCIPLIASPDTLFETLQQIITADLKILVLKTETSPIVCPTGGQYEKDDLDLAPSNSAPGDDAENGTIDRTISV